MASYLNKGIIKWYNSYKGFGVIQNLENKEECFFLKNRVYTDSTPCEGDKVIYFPSMGKKGLTAEAVYFEKSLYGEIIIFYGENPQENWNLIPEGFYATSVKNDMYNIFDLENQVNYILIPNYMSRVGTYRFFDNCPKNWANKKNIIKKEVGCYPYNLQQNYVEFNNQLVRADDFSITFKNDLAQWQEEVATATQNLKERISAFVAENSSFLKFTPSSEGVHLFLKEYDDERIYSFDDKIVIDSDDDEPFNFYISSTEEEYIINNFIRKYTNKIYSFQKEAKKLEASSEIIPQLCGFIFNGVEYNIDPV